MTLAPSLCRHGPRASLNARTQAAFTSTDTALIVVKQGAGDRQAGAAPAGMATGGPRRPKRPAKPSRLPTGPRISGRSAPSSLRSSALGDPEPGRAGRPGASRVFSSPECSPER